MAPMNKRVIAIVTAMLQTLEENPDEDVDELIKATLQAISVRKPSTIRALGDAFLNFADERPFVATAVILVVWAVPQQVVTGLWRTLYPSRVQIEVQEPADKNLHGVNDTVESMLHGTINSDGQDVIDGMGIGLARGNVDYAESHGSGHLQSDRGDSQNAVQTVQVVTPGGTQITWDRGSTADRSVCGPTGECGCRCGSVRRGIAEPDFRGGRIDSLPGITERTVRF